MALIRMEERIRFERIRPALCRNIARLEAISTIRIDGKDPSLRRLIELEDESIAKAMSLGGEHCVGAFESKDASLEAFRYLRTLEWLSENVKAGDKISPETLLEIHSRCVFGVPAAQSGVTFRKRELNLGKDLAVVYRAPAPEDLPALIDDLCVFMNKDVYSPNTHAALAHFQFESIKPFKTGLDRTGRALCHAIIYRRGLIESLIPPIGLMPAINTRFHAEHLLPYGIGSDIEGLTKARALDEWAAFCAHSVELAAHVTKAYIDTIIGLEKGWEEQVKKTNKGSALQELLLILPGRPVLTVSSAMRLIDRSFSATNDALLRLEEAGILRLVDSDCGRNRVFEAQEVFDAIDAMERHLLASRPVARDSFLKVEHVC